MKEAYEKIIDKLYNANSNSIILVYGPSGVGKFTLLAKVRQRIEKDYQEKMNDDCGFIPIVGIEAVPPDTGSFDWKDFYYRALVSLNEPLIDYKIDKQTNKSYGTKAGLRRSLENALKYRKPLGMLIDEGQHLTKTVSGRNLVNQMEVLKSLASMSNTPIILFGTYDLLDYRNLSGQLSRRGNDIHLRRYNYKDEADVRSFISILKAFQSRMPVEIEPDLVSHWEYFYERSIGCIGILKDWITVTLKICLRNDPNLKTIKMADFEKYSFSIDQCITLAKEAFIGEQKVKPKDELQSKLRGYLGIENSDTDIKNVKQESTNEGVKEKKNSMPGKRSPKRDKVGEKLISGEKII